MYHALICELKLDCNKMILPQADDAPGLGRRLVTMTYDSLLVAAFAMLITALLLGVRTLTMGSEAVAKQGIGSDRPLLQLLLFFGIFGFYCAFWRLRGQTLGMQAWRIKLVSDFGGNPSIWQCFVRYLGAIISLTCLGVGYLWVLVDPEQRSWHDHLSDTRLILLPKK
ncbi:MAG: putative RDD family membrane protein YckC [Halieaceae bacterium]|jgi:uncharacterized RDD family membrane protein YckC